jgi:peptide/nickel transport system substrate-binding protein
VKKSVLVLTVFMVLACRQAEQRKETVAAAARPSSTLTRRLETDAATLNYLLQTTDYERWVLQYLYDPLIDLDQNLQPIPGTARTWDISSDGKVYTLHLDPASTFSDGTPVLASDVVFTLKKVITENSMQFAGFFEGLDLAQTAALDPQTVRVVFKMPRVARWYAFNIGVLPGHVYGQGDFKTAFNDTVVGNGPYKLVRRERGRSILLQRRDDYRRTKPAIEKILFKVITDPATSWNALNRGEVDEMRVTAETWNANKQNAAVRDRFVFFDAYPLTYNCIAWNNTDPVLRDKRVRRAFSMALDRNDIIAHLYYGKARPISGPFTPDQWAYNAAVPAEPYDLRRAGSLLDEAGWRDSDGDGIRDRNGRKLSVEVLIAANDTSGRAQSQLLQAALKQVGVDVSIGVREGTSLFEAIMKGDYQGAFMAWSVDPDPDLYSLFHSKAIPPAGLNVVHYANPQVDKLIEASQTEFVATKRREIFHRLHALLADDQPYTWTVQGAQNWAVNHRVHDVKMSKGFGLFGWYPGPLAWTIGSE